MNREQNKLIAVNGFCTLMLDYEFKEDEHTPAAVFCRVLSDGYYAGRITASSQAEAIEKFYRHEY